MDFDIKSGRFIKNFPFSKYLPFSKKAIEVLGFCISSGFNSTKRHVFQGEINNFVIWFWAWIILNNIILHIRYYYFIRKDSAEKERFFLKKTLYSMFFLSRQYRINDKTSAVTFRALCIYVSSCCCRLSCVNSLLFCRLNMDFGKPLTKRKSQLKYEAETHG